jgi:hypothetical protein
MLLFLPPFQPYIYNSQLTNSQLSKTPQIDMQLRHPKRNMPQTIKRLGSEPYIPEIVFYAGEIDFQVGEALDTPQVQDGVEEGRDVAGEVGDGLGGDPGEDVLEVVVLAGEEVTIYPLALILDFLPRKKGGLDFGFQGTYNSVFPNFAVVTPPCRLPPPCRDQHRCTYLMPRRHSSPARRDVAGWSRGRSRRRCPSSS